MKIFFVIIGITLLFTGLYDALCPPTPEPTPESTTVPEPTDTSVPVPTNTHVVPTDTAIVPTDTVVPTYTYQPTETIRFTETITPAISTSVYTYTESTVVPGIIIRKQNGATPTPNMDMPNTGFFDEPLNLLMVFAGLVLLILAIKGLRKVAKL